MYYDRYGAGHFLCAFASDWADFIDLKKHIDFAAFLNIIIFILYALSG